ncbi:MULTISPECIES: type II toxin-antitoxin system HicB family antitoxin [Geomonas]|uniref:Type II toxin-antitoxin system HicB family antitoxin n=2 Tax=Geomonas TaxID=2651583 RepID=A0ABS0YJH0_9BACT|nr:MULTISPECIES: type II toxin-antitoxin system HicB family antitoxin [Geomonas]MBJ6752502.1 type II toxin-antitoxin system HicB family antitoxin [Geomonas anaerohicana]QWV94869.1 type II toxin-antitoxin system HicB family antitoxin [Geomonas oryzisoli]
MLYPVYLHGGDDKHAHGVVIPDFPGCFSAADSEEDLPRMIQEAAEVYFDGEDMEIPPPTPLEQLKKDPNYEGGIWRMVDIDVTRLSRKGH